MEYTRFTQALRDARITIRQLAMMLHMNPNSITNHARSGVIPDHLGAIAMLIGTMAKHGINYAGPLERAGLRGKQPRGKSFGGAKHLMRRAAPHAAAPSKARPPQCAPKAVSGLGDRPRFWYPADLNLPDTEVSVVARPSESIEKAQKPVTVIHRKRRRVGGNQPD